MKTLALGSKDSAFYKSISDALFSFGDITYKSEHDFKYVKDLVEYINKYEIERVLMPNPYGNNKRNACYRKLKEIDVDVVASDRGALPDSWFFDNGFNADSPSYKKGEWDYPLTVQESTEVEGYLSSLIDADKALEAQGARVGGDYLRENLGLIGKKVLFVPMQRPEDTVIKHFSGAIESLIDFVEKVSGIADTLSEDGWVVVLKKHPLESDYILPSSEKVKYVYNSAHVNDLIEMADAVLLVNSGVGLLAMAWNKPVYHFGEAFYSIEGVNKKVDSIESASTSIRNGLIVDVEKVRRFYYHLINRVYSFATFQTEKVKEQNGASRNITRHINFRTLIVNGDNYPVNGRKILVVTSVVPRPIYRGSQARIDTVISSLIKSGSKVGLIVMNTSFRGKRSVDIEGELKKAYKGISYVKVIKSPALSVDRLSVYKSKLMKFTDRVINKNSATKIVDCPSKFKRAVSKSIDDFLPDSVLINYAKLTPLIPRDYDGEAIIDTHDYQTQFLKEELEQNGNPDKISIEKFRRSEISLLNRFDKIVAINRNEKNIFEKITNTKVYCVPAFCESNLEKKSFMLGYEYDALFVGSISTFNVSGLLWFLNEVLPKVKSELPRFRLAVVGDVCKSKQIDQELYPNVDFLGRVDDLKNSYNSSKAIIAPILSGAGMKIKVVEALSYGKPVIGTAKAFDGIEVVNKKSALVEDSPELFSKVLVEIISNRDVRKGIERQAEKLYQENHSLHSIESAIEQLVNT
ncbi:MAG: glycosyltransferase [Colwellia sp.]|jgi:Glycosyltransferase